MAVFQTSGPQFDKNNDGKESHYATLHYKNAVRLANKYQDEKEFGILLEDYTRLLEKKSSLDEKREQDSDEKNEDSDKKKKQERPYCFFSGETDGEKNVTEVLQGLTTTDNDNPGDFLTARKKAKDPDDTDSTKMNLFSTKRIPEFLERIDTDQNIDQVGDQKIGENLVPFFRTYFKHAAVNKVNAMTNICHCIASIRDQEIQDIKQEHGDDVDLTNINHKITISHNTKKKIQSFINKQNEQDKNIPGGYIDPESITLTEKGYLDTKETLADNSFDSMFYAKTKEEAGLLFFPNIRTTYEQYGKKEHIIEKQDEEENGEKQANEKDSKIRNLLKKFLKL